MSTARLRSSSFRVIPLILLFSLSPPASAQPEATHTTIDRVIVRFEAAELGGASHPRFVFERVLAFQARLEALAEAKRGMLSTVGPYEERHVRAALERHITEEILASLPVHPPLTADNIRRRSIAAWVLLQDSIGGRQNLLDAAFAEALEMEDIEELILRRVRASSYLDRMVTPMLDPSDAQLREVLRAEPTPFRGKKYSEVADELRHWYVADRLTTSLAAFFRSARARIKIVVFEP